MWLNAGKHTLSLRWWMNESIQSYNSSFFLVVASSFFIYILIEQEFSVFIELNNCTFSRRIRILSYVVWLYYCALMVLLWFCVFTYFISFRIYWLRNQPRKRQHTLSHFFRRKNLSKPLARAKYYWFQRTTLPQKDKLSLRPFQHQTHLR